MDLWPNVCGKDEWITLLTDSVCHSKYPFIHFKGPENWDYFLLGRRDGNRSCPHKPPGGLVGTN